MYVSRHPVTVFQVLRPLLVCSTGLLAGILEILFLCACIADPFAFFLGLLFIALLFVLYFLGHLKGLQRGMDEAKRRKRPRKPRSSFSYFRIQRDIERRFPLVLALGIPGLVYHLGYQRGYKLGLRIRPIPPHPATAIARELETLHFLHARGALTEEEFAKAKYNILHPERT